MTGFDAAIHPPARLQIMAVLTEVQDAEFALLRSTTGVSDLVLSKHLSALVEANYVALPKSASDVRSWTWASATRAGRKAFAAHVSALTALARVADRIAAE